MPKHPYNGAIMNSAISVSQPLHHKAVQIVCNNDKHFLRPIPKWYSCFHVGKWNLLNPKEDFKFPSCGS